jgi:AcrR family transcriptional regulator
VSQVPAKAPRARPKSTKPAQSAGPATRDPERTSAAILAAATAEFTEKGYGGARVDAIAQRSGVNKRMIYHYFGNKEALYRNVLESAYFRIRSAEAGLNLEHLEPIEAIRQLVRFTWDYVVHNPNFVSILNTENMHKARYLKRSNRILPLHSPLVVQLQRILNAGAAQGVFRSGVDAVNLYISVASLCFFYLSNRWTLSTIFQRDLNEKAAIAAWGLQVEEVILGWLRA